MEKKMNLPFISILIMGILPIVCAGIAKFGGNKDFNTKENRNPREFLAKLSGWRQRANAAQANSFEALPLYTAAVLVAAYNHANQACILSICATVVILRIIYIYLYITDKPTLRSIVWGVAFIMTASMFFIH
jgi:uncharacterized MAPEG superfamily protein